MGFYEQLGGWMERTYLVKTLRSDMVALFFIEKNQVRCEDFCEVVECDEGGVTCEPLEVGNCFKWTL